MIRAIEGRQQQQNAAARSNDRIFKRLKPSIRKRVFRASVIGFPYFRTFPISQAHRLPAVTTQKPCTFSIEKQQQRAGAGSKGVAQKRCLEGYGGDMGVEIVRRAAAGEASSLLSYTLHP